MHLCIKPELLLELQEYFRVRGLPLISSKPFVMGDNPARTIVMLWIASCFHIGSTGSNTTSSFCSTPRLKVEIA
jgi:hypothetical protein